MESDYWRDLNEAFNVAVLPACEAKECVVEPGHVCRLAKMEVSEDERKGLKLWWDKWKDFRPWRGCLLND